MNGKDRRRTLPWADDSVQLSVRTFTKPFSLRVANYVKDLLFLSHRYERIELSTGEYLEVRT